MSQQPRKRGLIPTSVQERAQHEQYLAPMATPPLEWAWLPSPGHISDWGNHRYGDCVAAEEAFAKACNGEILTSDYLIAWAKVHGVLDRSSIPQVLKWMQNDGFCPSFQWAAQPDVHIYDDGPFCVVNYWDSQSLQSAIVSGPVKLGVGADQLEQVARGNGWFATGFHAESNPDHCVSLCGFGPLAWLAAKLSVQVPSRLDPDALGYLMFTWGTLGIIDGPSMQAITSEAWLRLPTTVQRNWNYHYWIENKATRQCLAILGASSANGAPVALVDTYDPNSSGSARWTIQTVPSTDYCLIGRSNNSLYLNIINGETADFAYACQGNSPDTPNFYWTFCDGNGNPIVFGDPAKRQVPTPETWFTLQVASSQKYLQAFNGQALQDSYAASDDSYLWRVVPLADGA